jgi:death-on-curing protein
MHSLTLGEVVELYRSVVHQTGGSAGIRDLGALESALAQPRATFGGQELHATLIDKAAALGFSIILNHPFVDGNKRIGHAAMETSLVLNGHEIVADVDEQERMILAVAAGELDREALATRLETHVKPLPS